MENLPKLYTELADWFHLLTAPEDYAEEAEFYRKAIVSSCQSEPRTMLELGSGGGNNASHLKRHFEMTLVDLSPRMLDASRKLNPECGHIDGDMRTIRLDRRFDAVFVHDAIVYMRSIQDLRAAIDTAYKHCGTGGAALFAPDYTAESFKPNTFHGGHDSEERSLRYLEWVWDPDPDDSTYVTQMVYVLREGVEPVRCVEERHLCGLFSKDRWLRAIEEAGFEPRWVPFEHSEIEPGSCGLFLGMKPAG